MEDSSEVKIGRGRAVAVVGGAGYVGSSLCLSLAGRGFKVLCIDPGVFADPYKLFLGKDIGILKMDAMHLGPKDLKDFDSVVNLGGFSNDPTAQAYPYLNWKYNVNMAAKVADVASRAGVERLVYASSASVYHSGGYEYDAELGEQFNVRPVHHYSCSKYAGEMASFSFNDPHIKNLSVTVLRKGTVSGPSPRMRYDLLLNTMFRSAFSDGKICVTGGGGLYRPMLDIRDAVSAYEATLLCDPGSIAGHVFNVVSENATVLAFADTVSRVVERELEKFSKVEVSEKATLVRSYRVSSRKIGEVLGWFPKYRTGQTVTDLCHWKRIGLLQPFDDPTTENIKMASRLEELGCGRQSF